jgi:hypothetical protein
VRFEYVGLLRRELDVIWRGLSVRWRWSPEVRENEALLSAVLGRDILAFEWDRILL